MGMNRQQQWQARDAYHGSSDNELLGNSVVFVRVYITAIGG
jgi:hypothetical protein